MKLRVKIFLSILVVSLAAFGASSYYLINRTHLSNIDREQERSLNEFEFLHNALINSFDYTLATDEANLLVISRYVTFYSGRGIELMIYQGLEPYVVDFMKVEKDAYQDLLTVKEGTKKLQIIESSGNQYFFVSGMLGDSKALTLLYARDISYIYRDRMQNITLSLILAFGLTLLLTLLSYLFSRWITTPIDRLQQGAELIKDGDYSVRIPVTNDEFHPLGNAFNTMAAAVELRTEELSLRAKELQVFIDDLSHEMNTPLTSIQGYAEFLINADASEEQKQKAADIIRLEAKRMKDIYTKLMTLTFAREHKQELTSVDLTTLFSEVADTFRVQLTELNIDLVIDAQLNTLSADRIMLHMLLSNLVKNSIGALSSGGRITLQAYSSNKDYVLEVSDNGCGIPQESLAEVTKPFYRVDKSRSRKTGGVGIGLSICQTIADIHNASLSISSKEGQGTTVKIIFH